MWVRSNKGNVFVGNLPVDFSDEQLAETFDPFGIVLSAIVARDPATGARLRYGFVDIATDKAATQAISALNGIEIGGCKLNVKPRERSNGAKKPAGGGPRRAPFRAAPPRRTPIGGAEPRPEAPPRPAQSSRIAEASEEIGPPPRRDFEVVYKPARRKVPSFQVERRPLPRRV